MAPDDPLVLAFCLVRWDAVPFFATVVSIALAIVIDDEVIFVQTVANNLLVSVFVNFLVQILRLLDLVSVELLLARLTQSSQLREFGALVDGCRHGSPVSPNPIDNGQTECYGKTIAEFDIVESRCVDKELMQ
jgi:hypothetical protein